VCVHGVCLIYYNASGGGAHSGGRKVKDRNNEHASETSAVFIYDNMFTKAFLFPGTIDRGRFG
jgi:hypothetical protein